MADTTLIIISLNIRGCRKKGDCIIKLIKEHTPDFIFLQEIENEDKETFKYSWLLWKMDGLFKMSYSEFKEKLESTFFSRMRGNFQRSLRNLSLRWNF